MNIPTIKFGKQANPSRRFIGPIKILFLCLLIRHDTIFDLCVLSVICNANDSIALT